MILKNTLAWQNGKFKKVDIEIKGEIINRIGRKIAGEEVIDCDGRMVIPGVIDPHVHLRDLGQSHKETFRC